MPLRPNATVSTIGRRVRVRQVFPALTDKPREHRSDRVKKENSHKLHRHSGLFVIDRAVWNKQITTLLRLLRENRNQTGRILFFRAVFLAVSPGRRCLLFASSLYRDPDRRGISLWL